MADDERRFSDEEIHDMVRELMGMAGVDLDEVSEKSSEVMRKAVEDWRRRKMEQANDERTKND